ncbi:MAG: hypothetical protein ACPGYV_15295 [Phycisphaeraceae bacterium]
MPFPVARRLPLVLPILFYGLALIALRLHLPTGDRPLLIVAALAGLVAVGIGVMVVRHHRVSVERVSSRA